MGAKQISTALQKVSLSENDDCRKIWSENCKRLTHLTGFNRRNKSFERWQLLKTNHSFQLSLVQPVNPRQRRHLAALLATHQMQELSIIGRLAATTYTMDLAFHKTQTDWLINEKLSCGFTSHSTQNRSFSRCSPRQSLGLVWKNQT